MTPQEFETETKRNMGYLRSVCAQALFAYRLSTQPADVDDAVQMTIESTFKSLPQFRGECSLMTLMYLVATRVAFRLARKERVNRPRAPTQFDVELDMRPRAPREPDDILISKEAQARIEQAIATLTPPLRSAVAHKRLGMTDVEGAALSGVPPATERTRLFHAHRKLRMAAAKMPAC